MYSQSLHTEYCKHVLCRIWANVVIENSAPLKGTINLADKFVATSTTAMQIRILYLLASIKLVYRVYLHST